MWASVDRALVGKSGAGPALTNDQVRLLEPLISRAKVGGQPRATDTRNLFEACSSSSTPTANEALSFT
jgi:putative transposase